MKWWQRAGLWLVRRKAVRWTGRQLWKLSPVRWIVGKLIAGIIRRAPAGTAKLVLGFMLRAMFQQMGMTAAELVPAFREAVLLIQAPGSVDFGADLARQERAEGMVEILAPAFAEFQMALTPADVEPLLGALADRLEAEPGTLVAA